jgi:arylsulfatase A-like enzyme
VGSATRKKRQLLGLVVALVLGTGGVAHPPSDPPFGLAGKDAAPARPNLILVVVDTLRADRLPSYGYLRPTAPFLEELARRGTVFERVIASSSWTKTAMASLFTASDPLVHGVRREFQALPEAATTLAEALRDAGYRTIGVNTNPWLTDRFGFDAGFETYESGAYADARAVNARALELVSDSPQPFFLYLHYMDVHAPYTPDPRWVDGEALRLPGGEAIDDAALEQLYRKEGFDAPGTARRVQNLYEAQIRGLDDALRELAQGLENRGLLKDAVLVVTADHGEGFREHGTTEHGWNLYPEVHRVPLIAVAPGRIPAGERVAAQVRSIDIAPTLLALAGIPPPESFKGRSLWPLDGLEDRVAIAAVGLTSYLPDTDNVAVITRDYLYVEERRHGGVELYDLRTDPGATRDLGRDHPAAARLAALLGAGETPLGDPVELDAATRASLEALGYLDRPDPLSARAVSSPRTAHRMGAAR